MRIPTPQLDRQALQTNFEAIFLQGSPSKKISDQENFNRPTKTYCTPMPVRIISHLSQPIKFNNINYQIKHLIFSKVLHKPIILAVGLSLSIVPSLTIAGPTAAEILEAARIAIQTQIPGSEFLSLLEGADIIEVAAVNIKIRNEQIRILYDEQDGKISSQVANERLDRLNEILSRLQDAKYRALGPHKDGGQEPSFDRFTSSVPLASPLPKSVVLTLKPESSSSFFTNPAIWGGGFTQLSTLNGQLKIKNDDNGFSVEDISYTIGSFGVNGQLTGTNQISIRPGSGISFTFDSATRSFTASYEGLMTNNLYPSYNPIVFFSDVSGLIMNGGTEVAIWTISEPAIIPGAPGQPPVDYSGMAYAPTKAVFDAQQGSLRFVDNIDVSKTPDISIERDAGGVYRSTHSALSELVDTRLSIDPLRYLGKGLDGSYLFSSERFTISNTNGPIIIGRLLNPHIDPHTYQFTATSAVDYFDTSIDDEFTESFVADGMMQLLGPVTTAELLMESNLFTANAESATDFINIHVPEPSSVSIMFIGLGSLAAAR
jgi:hypothetical protein